jgi:ABC-type glycerol-3-phosphate transport system substrate-binding protein
MKILRVAALMIAFLIAFSACAGNASEEVVPEFDNSGAESDPDLLGYEFTLAAMTHGGLYPLNPTSGESSRGDKLLARYKETEEKYNVKIKLMNESDLTRFMTLYAADIKYADLMFNMVNTLFGGRYIQNGYFIPFSDMDIDLSSGLYGTPQSIEAGYFNGDYYSIVAYYWGFPSADTMPAMWYNPAVISMYQQPDPHELDEQGSWDWTALEDMCEKIHDTSNPDPAMHTYALAYTSEPYLEFAALYSNGARPVTKGADGKLRYSLNTYNAIQALEFISSLRERDLICDGGDRQNIAPFIENRRAFFVEYTHLGLSDEGANNLAYQMQEAYEWILFPKGPDYVQGAGGTSFSYWSRFFYAPLNTDPEVHSILLPFMFRPLPGETVDTWQDEFERSTFFSSASFESFKELRDNAFCDYLAFLGTGFTNTLQPNLLRMTRGTASITETLESIEEKLQTNLDAFYNNYLD